MKINVTPMLDYMLTKQPSIYGTGLLSWVDHAITWQESFGYLTKQALAESFIAYWSQTGEVPNMPTTVEELLADAYWAELVDEAYIKESK